MRIYIMDCDRASRSELKRIIEEGNLGDIAGMSSRWEDAYPQVQEVRPDIILADFVQPVLKSIAYLQKIKTALPKTAVILLSQISDTKTVRQAYEKGAELLIHKPADPIEIRNVLHSLELARTMEWLMNRAASSSSEMQCLGAGCRQTADIRKRDTQGAIRRLKEVLHEIGISGESGSRDIIRLTGYLMEQKLDLGEVTMRDLCGAMNQNVKSTEQRIRRAAAEGMSYLASRGMDDYADPVFNEYAGRLYSFEQIKIEMNYIRGKGEKHGNVRVRNFLNGLLECCKEM